VALTPTPSPPVAQTYRSTGGAVIALSSDPVVVAGDDTAVATAQAEDTGASAAVGTDVVVFGDTAVASVTAHAGTPVLVDDGEIYVPGQTATANATAYPGNGVVGASVPGNVWQSPTPQNGATGSVVWSTGPYVTQPDEPDTVGYRSIWYVFYGSGDLTFTATASTAIILDVFDVGSNLSDPDSWSLIGTDTGTTATVANVFGNPVDGLWVRVSATTDTTFTVTLDWSTTVIPVDSSPGGSGSLLQVLDPFVQRAPFSVTYSMFNLDDGETVSVRIVPDPLGFGSDSANADEAGVILGETFYPENSRPARTPWLRTTRSAPHQTHSWWKMTRF
jgi:hypothetical protein